MNSHDAHLLKVAITMLAKCVKVYSKDLKKIEEVWEEDEKLPSSSEIDKNLVRNLYKSQDLKIL